MPNKLKLKRTPEEEAEHQRKKERKREKKRKREGKAYAHASSKRFHGLQEESPERKWASSDEEPGPSTSKVNYEALMAELEDRKFRAKMFDAMGEEDRLDTLEASFNGFAHIPEHWQNPSLADLGRGRTKAHIYKEDEFLRLDPSKLDDEEYAEWIRMGMYRKTHADEYAEQQRRKAAQEAKKAEEKAKRAEARLLEKQHEEERRQRKKEREVRRMDDARKEYEDRWTALLTTQGQDLSFDDIPWPVAAAYRHETISVDTDLTAEAISAFVLAGTDEDGRKAKLRDTLLRFHPDKFEGRVLGRVVEGDRARVQLAIVQVARELNRLK